MLLCPIRLLVASIVVVLLTPAICLAVGSSGGPNAFGINAAYVSPDQSDVDSWIDLATTGTKDLTSGYELSVDYEYRFTGSIWSFLIRPSYFSESASGGGVSASLTGYTFFPMLRFYPLENGLIHFFMQFGFGYGKMDLSLSNNGTSGSYSGDAYGPIAGLGVLFCFTESNCVTIEGNFRYLPIQVNTGTANGNLGGNITRSSGQLERNNYCVETSFSGVEGVLGYKFLF